MVIGMVLLFFLWKPQHPYRRHPRYRRHVCVDVVLRQFYMFCTSFVRTSFVRRIVVLNRI